MTQVCCPDCRLRFTPAATAHLAACPECGEPLQRQAGMDGMVGFRLFRLEDVPHALPEAVAVSIPVPDPGAARP
jgi:predicted amidophosphoribosyltransferase